MSSESDRPAAGDRFDFSSPLLRRPGVEFTRQEDRSPILGIDFGGQRATVDLADLRNMDELPSGHPDHRLLRFVAPALVYSLRIVAGSPIPTELVDGRPSWRPSDASISHIKKDIVRNYDLQIEASRLSAVDVLRSQPRARLPAGGTANEDAPLLDTITDYIESAACALDIKKSLIGRQRMLGDIARAAKREAGSMHGGVYREIALGIREVLIWASKQAMTLDMKVLDLRTAINDRRVLEETVWPAIAGMRAWVLDLEPVTEAWAGIRGQEHVKKTDLDRFRQLVVTRFSDFDPSIYRHAPLTDMASAGIDPLTRPVSPETQTIRH